MNLKALFNKTLMRAISTVEMVSDSSAVPLQILADAGHPSLSKSLCVGYNLRKQKPDPHTEFRILSQGSLLDHHINAHDCRHNQHAGGRVTWNGIAYTQNVVVCCGE